ncbi:hypothetical protein [Polyangium sp. 6x1]|uniref:hypothetical protein n=1 Tax=Polyangium sp. 6x1 TaxID=3042689 RepID=UPI0024821AA5|nr:hypothetical protein [Polyangium sp. 6x1]MDI1445411.1 hypothetical protein [Polyangium sp. 6x1]
MEILRSGPPRAAWLALVALGFCLSPGDARAVVEQTDGLVVPVQVANCPGSGNAEGCIQVGLNIGEGLAATAANNPLNAILLFRTRSGLPDIRLNHSTNGGVTWQPTSARADLGTVAGTSASTRPRVALGGASLVFVAWEDARSGQRDIFANHSFDGGATFQPLDLRMDVGTAGAPLPVGAADSRNPFVLTNAAGARALTIWTDNRTTAGANADIHTNFFE